MADTSGEADIRGLDIQKLVKGFADEIFFFKDLVTTTNTSAREIRWYKRTAGVLDSTDTSGITASQLENVDEGSLPDVIEESWTRQQSFIRKYFVESPVLTEEDMKDTDVTVLATNMKSLVRSIAKKINDRIYTIVTDTQATGSAGVETTAATGTGWDDTTNGNPILDIMNGQMKVRQNDYDAKQLVTVMNSIEHKWLLNYIINVKGSSIPNFSSAQVSKFAIQELLGNPIFVSESAVTDSVAQWIPKESGTWYSFSPMKTATIVEPLIGTKIRVAEHGECVLTDPKSVHIITDTIS